MAFSLPLPSSLLKFPIVFTSHFDHESHGIFLKSYFLCEPCVRNIHVCSSAFMFTVKVELPCCKISFSLTCKIQTKEELVLGQFQSLFG